MHVSIQQSHPSVTIEGKEEAGKNKTDGSCIFAKMMDKQARDQN